MGSDCHRVAALVAAVTLLGAGSACADSPTMSAREPSVSAAVDPLTEDSWWETTPKFFALALSIDSAIETQDGHSQKAEAILGPEAELEIGGIKWRAVGRARFDAVDRLEVAEPSQDNRGRGSRRWLGGDRREVELRELTAARSVGPVFVTLGKQQLVWGKADGLKILDVLNPQSFREFILPPFEDSRIPLWSANAEFPLGANFVQLVWLLDQTYNDVPSAQRGDAYAFTSTLLLPALAPNSVVGKIHRPRRVVRDSDIGLRISRSIAGWDVTLNYLYHYDDQLVFERTGILDDQGRVVVEPQYRRTHLIGGSFSTAMDDFVLRGEIGVLSRRALSSTDPADRDGITESGEFSYVLGLDWSGLSQTFVSVQLFQSLLANDASDLVRNRIETRATALIRRRLLNDRLNLDFIWIRSLTRSDGILRPRIGYTWSDNIEVYLGADVFHGTRKGVFGQFRSRDRITFGMEWTL